LPYNGASDWEGLLENIAEIVSRLVIELAIILAAAKLAGEVCERYLHVPSVLGELAVGVLIGPYALGGMSFLGLGPWFPLPPEGATIPVSSELYSVSQVAVVILLFVVGLETDFGKFLRYAGPASVVAVGGVVVPFFLGAYATQVFGLTDSMFAPEALFIGAVMTATSVGITARVLRDKKKLDSPEGVTVLGAAVVDDVLGILVLAIVVAVATLGTVSAGQAGWITAKAVAVWLGITGVGVLLASRLSRFTLSLRVEGASIAMGLALAFVASAIAEAFGLAMIIGAYSMGLALSNTRMAKVLTAHEPHDLTSLYHALVPIFFVVMGMLVDVRSFGGVLGFGLVLTFLAIVGKVVGCGLPSLAVGFNQRGAWRIGIGMMPRGEVALIIAGVGLAEGAITSSIFGVAILITMVTTFLGPLLLVPLFSGGSGLRRGEGSPGRTIGQGMG